MKQKLTQKLQTTITITPQLQQILRFLQLNNQEFVDEIIRELEENPIVEELGPDERNSPLNPEHYDIYEKEYFKFKMQNFEPYDALQSVSRDKTLVEYALEQLVELNVDPETREILAYAIYHLSRDGFRTCSDDEISAALGYNVEKVQRALAHFKAFDPIGIGARDAIECLLWQLEALGFDSQTLPARLLTDHRDMLLRGRLDLIARKESVSLEAVHEAIKLLRKLNPRPGIQFDNDYVTTVTPDLRLEIVDSDLRVELSKTKLPSVKLRTDYLKNCPDKQFSKILKEQFRTVKNLTKAVDQRESNLVRIAKAIVEKQRDYFLSYGQSDLKPMTLKDIADELNLHESTVSRATSNKYIETPFGIFELKAFFTNRISPADNDLSAERVKRLLVQLIENEDKNNPLSDADIASLMLSRYQIKVARRTVAKYRESLKIPSANYRKFFSTTQV